MAAQMMIAVSIQCEPNAKIWNCTDSLRCRIRPLWNVINYNWPMLTHLVLGYKLLPSHFRHAYVHATLMWLKKWHSNLIWRRSQKSKMIDASSRPENINRFSNTHSGASNSIFIDPIFQ